MNWKTHCTLLADSRLTFIWEEEVLYFISCETHIPNLLKAKEFYTFKLQGFLSVCFLFF